MFDRSFRQTLLVVLQSLLVMLVSPSPARATSNVSAKIQLHLAGTVAKVCLVPPACSNQVTHGELAPLDYYAFVLVTDADLGSGVQGCSFGIEYPGPGAADGIGIDILSWTTCNGAPTIASGNWPNSGSGAVIPLGACSWQEPGGPGTGVVAAIGYFYCTAYSPAALRVVPRQVDGLATVTDCGNQVRVVEGGTVTHTPSYLGIAGFGNGETGYSPCNAPCSSATAPPEFVQTWGSPGSGPGQFNRCDDVACDAARMIYATDRNNHRVQVFDRIGHPIGQWGEMGSGNGQFSSPTSIAVDNLGHVFVGDQRNSRVQRFDQNGVFQRAWGSAGTGIGQFRGLAAVAVSATGNVYVSDAVNCRIQEFTNDGVFIRTWGSPGTANGQFNAPEALDFGPDGRLYVADTFNHRIQVFLADGTYVSMFGSSGTGNGQFNLPTGIALDGLGNIYVSDYLNYRIQKFSNSGLFKAKWGSSGSGNGQFQGSYSVESDPDGVIYVADTDNHRIQKFGCSIDVSGVEDGGTTSRSRALVATPNPFANRTLIPFSLSVPTVATLTIHDLGGHRIRQLWNGAMQAGLHEVPWDGLDGHGNPTAAGIYFARLQTPGHLQTAKLVKLK
jgi:hypothetical protein